MQTNLIDRQPVSAKFEVTIPAQEVDKTYDEVFRTLSRQVRVPGFRPGKAPKGVIIQRIGQDALNQEVRDALVEANYPQAIRELELIPVDARFNAEEPSEGSDYTFEVELELFPDFNLPDLQEIVIDTAAPPLTDQMVEEAVAELQRENALQVPVDRPVQAGDYVLVETVREGEEEGSVLPIDLERVDEAFAHQLIGKAMGDEVELNLASGQDAAEDGEESRDDEVGAAGEGDGEGEVEAAAAPELPKLKVIIKDVKEKEKPEVDDEFAKTLGFESWDEVDAKIRENLQAELDADAFQEQREEFIEKLVEETTVELPPSLVNRRKSSLLSNLTRELQQAGATLEDYIKNLDESENREAFDAELQESAEAAVKRDLVLERLLDARGTTVDNKEFNDALTYMAARERKDLATFQREMGQEWLTNYRFLLARDKAVREAVRELLGEEEETADEAAGGGDSSITAQATEDSAADDAAESNTEEAEEQEVSKRLTPPLKQS